MFMLTQGQQRESCLFTYMATVATIKPAVCLLLRFALYPVLINDRLSPTENTLFLGLWTMLENVYKRRSYEKKLRNVVINKPFRK